MEEYQIELKQTVSFPRCRIYRQFIRSLMEDRSIRVSGCSYLFFYTVLFSYANYQTSYQNLDGIRYIVFPGEWICPVSEITEWFRMRSKRKALQILKELQEQHFIEYSLLGRGKLVKFKIKEWRKSNRLIEDHAPCQKDTGFFFFPISKAHELVSLGRCSEMDIVLDLWMHAIYNDPRVQGSELGPLFFSFLFIKLVRYADQYGEDGRLPIPVTIIGDEWPNIGTVPDLPKKISTIRSRALSLVCCFQNLPQLQNRYPYNAWQEILGNCDTTVFMGCTDPLTAQFVSDRTGEASIAVSSQSKMLGTWRISSYTPEYRETDSIGKRKLLTMDEIMRFPMDQTLVFLRGQKVLKLKKFDYSRHPDAKKLVKRKAAQHMPEWRLEQEKASPSKDASRPSVDPSVQAAEPPAKKTTS